MVFPTGAYRFDCASAIGRSSSMRRKAAECMLVDPHVIVAAFACGVMFTK